MVDYSKFDNIGSDDEAAPAPAGGYSEEERARLMAEVRFPPPDA
jgi:hypothetical protein